MYKYLLIAWLLAGCIFTARAQNPDTARSAGAKSKFDTLKSTRQDTDIIRSNAPKIRKEKVYHPDSTHSPHKAVMRSLLVPGWGQVYNHKIWKLPIIYGGLGLIGWAYVFNAQYYREFLKLSYYRYHSIVPQKGDPYYNEYQLYSPGGLNPQQDQSIYNAKDGYRRNRDLSILGFFGAWGINVVDAYIDAKFIHSYTLDNNFSMHVAPTMISQPVYAQSFSSPYIPGIKITFAL